MERMEEGRIAKNVGNGYQMEINVEENQGNGRKP